MLQRIIFLLVFCTVNFWISAQGRVVQGEYFWDGDPGQGNGTALLATDGNFDKALEHLFQSGIDVSSLNQGAHSFSVRIKGFDGTWSNAFRQTIYIDDGPLAAITRTFKLIQGEYFWDGDPGLGNGTALLAADGNFDQALEQLFQTGINVSSLNSGAHSFSVRIKGSDGTWSNAFRQTIYIDGPFVAITRPFKLIQAEYFWDGDPGPGNGTALLAADGNFDQALEQLFQNGIDVSSLNLGAHTFSVRIKGFDGTWSNAFRQIIHIDGPLIAITRTFKLTQGEYFWDNDPGQGNATPLLAADGNFDTVLENLMKNNIDLSSLSLGAHSFAVRVRGFDGSWSPLFKQTVFVECSSPTVPTVTIALSGNNACSGTPVQYTAAVVNGGTAPAFTWKVNGTAAGTNSPVFTSSTLVNGDVLTCDLVSNSTCAGTTSVTSNSLTVSLTPSILPTVSISASASGNICAGTPVTFNAAITHGGTSPVYVWKVNGGVVGSNSPVYASSALQNGDVVRCELTSNETCAVPAVVTSTGITMSVSNIVTPAISISVPATAVCAGTSVTFTANANGGGSSPVYQWKVNGSNAGTNQNVFSSAILNSGDVVTCELTSSLNCVTTSSAASNSISMTVSPIVSTSVAISSSAGSTICSGTSVTFTAVPTNGGTPVYQWRLNGFPVGTNSSTYVTSALSNGDVVTCSMTSSLVCPSPAVAISNSITMNVNNGAAPTASIVSNQGSSICGVTNVVFTASVTNGGSAPVYQWMLNGSPVGTNSPTYSNAGLADGNTVSCSVTSNSPCVNGTVAASNTITMSVSNIVTPVIAVSASATTICAGTSITFTATATNGGSAPAYQWKVNGSNAGTNSNTFSSTALNNGDIVSCTLTSSLNCVTASSVASNSITITVNPVAAASVSISSSSGSTICAGTNVTFTAVPTNGGTPVYQWKLNGSPVGANSNTFSSTTLSNGNVVTCEMTSSLACPSPAVATSNSITMTVNSVSEPTVSIASSAGNSICTGTSVTFTATSTNGGSSPAYQWMLNGSPVGTNSTVYINSTLADNDVVSCVLTSNAPCPATITATSNTITMTVTPVVPASVSISASATNICSGTAVVFTAVPTNGGTPDYQWKIGSANVGTNSNTFTSSVLTDGAIVTCLMTSSLGCAAPATVVSNAVTIAVGSSANPTVSITSNPAAPSICSGIPVTFTANITNGGSAPVYQWTLNGNNVGTNASTYTNAALATGDIVNCQLTSNAACATSTQAISNGITMDLISIDADVTTSGNTLTANQAGASYQWINCGNANAPVPGATAQTFTPVVDGMYAVVITMSGCTETSDCILVSTIDVEKLDQETWKVYPNPATEKLYVTIERAEVVRITDVSGKIVAGEQLQAGDNIIDVSQFAPGVYFIQAINGGANVKFVKE